jgi:hypothetical protein
MNGTVDWLQTNSGVHHHSRYIEIEEHVVFDREVHPSDWMMLWQRSNDTICNDPAWASHRVSGNGFDNPIRNEWIQGPSVR